MVELVKKIFRALNCFIAIYSFPWLTLISKVPWLMYGVQIEYFDCANKCVSWIHLDTIEAACRFQHQGP